MKKMTVIWAAALAVSGAAFAAVAPDMVRAGSNVGTLPKFDAAAWEYLRGWYPPDAKGDNGPMKDSVVPESVRVFTRDGRELVRDVDFAVDPDWGSVGVIGKPAENPTVKYRIDYSYVLQRLDSRIRLKDGRETVRCGVPVKCAPRPPALGIGETCLANVHVRRSVTNEYPVLEGADRAPRTKADAAARIPKTLAKLERGEPVTILAWGDSVTAGRFLKEDEKWQVRFVDWLRGRYPKSAITLKTCAWPGRTSSAFLAQKPGSEFCYAEKVAGEKADLVISEFINDADLTLADWQRVYGRVLSDFRAGGKEWIILTPHYAWHPLMKFPDGDETDDPRPFVKFLRTFAQENGIGLADASLRWGHLKKEGIPYETLLVNGINHPTPEGMGFFVDALKDFFGADAQADGADAYRAFAEPSAEVRPWAYYWWMNGHADEETIERDIALIAELGFGGILFFDMRNYWDDDAHVALPEAEIDFMGERWNDLVATTIRECAKRGLVFSMNASSSGGTLAGYRGKELYEVDISDRKQVEEHLDRLFRPIFARVGGLVGTTFRQVYSVSWEGKTPKGADPQALNRKILTNFYGAMRDWAHAHGLTMSSESGGPWRRAQGDFVGADQLEFLGVNDVPQGEFWLKTEKVFLCSPVANAARVYGRRIAAAEAFTHMEHHWSVVPEDLKRQADRAFVDGINRLLWHGFTASPDRFGVPGIEYFAGTHLNRHVTWCGEAGAFVRYLARCQAVLQRGEAVVDIGVLGGSDPYRHWGHYRDEPWEGSGIRMPDGYQFDVLTPRTPEAAKARYACLVDATKTPVVFPKLPLPDCLLPGAWDFAHRRDGGTDYYFVVGEGWGEGIFRVSGERAEIWDPVTGRRYAAPFERLGDGRAFLTFELPRNCAFFVVFGAAIKGTDLSVSPYLRPGFAERKPVAGPWDVAFAYPVGVKAEAPKARRMTGLVNWGKSEDPALRAFSGTATYRTKVVIDAREAAFGRAVLNLGSIGVGVAHVFVNGKDCGAVWSSPWTADVTGTLRAGGNDIEVRVTNTWANRLAADARHKPEEQATETNVKRRPTHGMSRCAGYDLDYGHQDCGLLGPVCIEFANEDR